MAMVLYRKYRPGTFAEIIGQEHIVQTLKNALEMDLVSHAYLFSGPRGSGKTTIARLLAKAANCEKRKGPEPCGSCFSCEEINAGRAMDLVEIDAASNRGIDEVRELREGVRFSPTRSKYRVFIIDEAHQLTKEAANALLKMLEEPPLHAMFILATTEVYKMIPTILSRCQKFDFHKLKAAEIIGRLEWIAKREKVAADKSTMELIAAQSGGSMRDAESLFGQAITYSAALGKKKLEAADLRDLLGLVETQSAARIIDLLVEKRAAPAIEFLNDTLESGRDPQELARTLVSYLRYGLLLKIALADAGQEDSALYDPVASGFTAEELAHLKSQAAGFREEQLRRMVKLFMDAETKIKYSPIPQLPLELAIIEAIGGKD